MIYTNIVVEINRHKMNVTELAHKMNLSKIALENKLSGLRDFTIDEIDFILKEFSDCSFEYLFEFNHQ